MPASLAVAAMASWARRPSFPSSAKPELKMTALRTPAAAHSASTCGTTAARTAMAAVSTGPGTAPMLEKAGRPLTVCWPGLTG